jgi:hypothetical protein
VFDRRAVGQARSAQPRPPWFDLIDQGDGVFDPALEPELKRRRVAQLFGQADHDPSGGAAR